jgi:hypothetical protein
MTEHDLELARQAGFDVYSNRVYFNENFYMIDVDDQLAKFAELIRAEKTQGEAYAYEIHWDDVITILSNDTSDIEIAKKENWIMIPLYTIPPDQSTEIARLNKFISNAFLAHPNLDLDIEAVLKENT